MDKCEPFRNRIRCRILKAEVLGTSPTIVCKDLVGSREGPREVENGAGPPCCVERSG